MFGAPRHMTRLCQSDAAVPIPLPTPITKERQGKQNRNNNILHLYIKTFPYLPPAPLGRLRPRRTRPGSCPTSLWLPEGLMLGGLRHRPKILPSHSLSPLRSHLQRRKRTTETCINSILSRER